MLTFREVLKWLLQNKAVGHKNGGGGWWVKMLQNFNRISGKNLEKI